MLENRDRAAEIIAAAVEFASQSVAGGSDPRRRVSSQRWIALARACTYFADDLVIARAHGESAPRTSVANPGTDRRMKALSHKESRIRIRYGQRAGDQHPRLTGSPPTLMGTNACIPEPGSCVPLFVGERAVEMNAQLGAPRAPLVGRGLGAGPSS